jgi:hypothetical protein
MKEQKAEVEAKQNEPAALRLAHDPTWRALEGLARTLSGHGGNPVFGFAQTEL